MELVSLYHTTIAALAAVGGLQFVQLLVADAAGIKSGHKPGSSPEANHQKFHFRSVRTVANTNESLGIFIVFALAGILGAADPKWLGWCAWAYVIARAVYAMCYWFNIKTLRSVVFGVVLLALLGMGITLLKAFLG